MKDSFFQNFIKVNKKKIRRMSKEKHNKDFLKEMMGNYYHKIRKEKIEIIKKYLFPDFKNDEIREICKNFTEKFNDKNEIIGEQGENIKFLYLLTKGEVLITKKYIRNFQNKNFDENVCKINKFNTKKIIIKKNLCTLSRGALIGLFEVMGGNRIYKYSYCVKRDNTNFFKISIDDFFEIIKKEKRRFFFEQKNLLYKNLLSYSEKKIEHLINIQNNFGKKSKKFSGFNLKFEKDNFLIKKLEDNLKKKKQFHRFRMRSQNSNLLIKNFEKRKKMEFKKSNISFLTNIKNIKNEVKKNKKKFFGKKLDLNLKKKEKKKSKLEKQLNENQQVFRFINRFRNVNENSFKKKIISLKKNKLKNIKFKSQDKKYFNPQKKVFSNFIRKTSDFILSNNKESLFIRNIY